MKIVEAKIVVLGSQGVGKTSLVVRYIGKMFSKHISPTIGASFFTCNISVDDARVKLQVWDTAGQERFRAMAPMYYRNANAALLVFDITSAASFQAIKGWVHELQSNVPEAMVLSLVGNKCDLSSQRAVAEEEATQFAEGIGALYCETSALHDQREVAEEEVTQFAEGIGALYCETSALHDQGIDQVFLSTAAALLRLSSTAPAPASLRTYDSSDDDRMLAGTGTATDEAATHMGTVELPVYVREHSVPHGETPRNMCC